ncbi:hypothetical protein ACIOHS_42660 [Streptomyces sp. NPDC088253]|uniref:hypothetical protein n=1 Tax=Streptomyces sp. NPDC088253 TaxID=3365846 RepID=UPI00382E8B43
MRAPNVVHLDPAQAVAELTARHREITHEALDALLKTSPTRHLRGALVTGKR